MNSKDYNQTENNEKLHVPQWSFARGSISYFILAACILVAVLFGVFDPIAPKKEYEKLGSFGDYEIIAKKQGMNVYEVTLHNKNHPEAITPFLRDDIKKIVWITAKTYEIQSFHPIEEKGKITGLIVTVMNE